MRGRDASDGDLVARARKGDVDAFHQLYDRHVSGVYGLVYAGVRDRDLADDVVQMAFVRAWERLGRLRHGDAFPVWIRRLAHRIMIDELRKRRVREVASLEENEALGEVAIDTTPGPAAALSRGETAERVRAAVAELPQHQREVVTLHHFEGLEVKAVAEVLEVPLGTVLSRLARARETLKRKLEGYLNHGTEGGVP